MSPPSAPVEQTSEVCLSEGSAQHRGDYLNELVNDEIRNNAFAIFQFFSFQLL
jgi:hypothetical protein